MPRVHSPGYPNMSLPKAIAAARKIFDADRRNPIDRAVAAKHMGYSGPSGASDKALASLAHYGLTEKTGKGEIKVSQLALDIIHPEKPEHKPRALFEAGFKPQVFKDLKERFGGHVSEEALRSYLIRENFQNIAINPVMNAYFETCRFLEQEKAIESGGESNESGTDSPTPKQGDQPEFGGAKVGDLIQWEANGALQMEQPMRVRWVSDDGQWVAVDDSETGIPMDEVLVEERAKAVPAPPPVVPAVNARGAALTVAAGETEWMRNAVGRDTKVRLLVSGGEMGPREIGKLIKILTAQKAVLSDEDDEDSQDSPAADPS